MKVVFSFCLLFLSFSLNAQTFEVGKIIDSVLIPKTNGENFTLYLPSSYNTTALSPIVFIFDPGGSGKNGITPFIEASETYGHILICSNDIRNGPYVRNFELVQRLFDHTFSIFNIEEKQAYLAGFSGGSRLASSIATLTNSFVGVIACGAGFSGIPELTPSNQDFSYVGICGKRGMNYTEMIGVKAHLEKNNFNNTLITFDGGHRWPPPKQILKAFNWLRLEAHKKNILKLEDEEIKNLYKESYLEARQSEENSNFLDALENYQRIISTYSSFYQLDSIHEKTSRIRKNKVYKQAIKTTMFGFEKEIELGFLFYNRFNSDYANTEKIKLSWWKKELKSLNKIPKKENVALEKMVDRVKSKLSVMVYSKRNSQSSQPSIKQKEFSANLLKLIYPDYDTN